jgi:probable F420-dependent oxidoreductase
MEHGIVIFSTDYAIRPDELARAAEERGFESLFVPEHTHIPVSRRTPYPGGGELPKEYSHTMDPFVSLAAAAAVTKKIKLATGICLVIEHDPIVLAKEVATLDVLSNGRFILGIGAGWNVEEMENHGTNFKTRWKLLRERVEAMKAIWSNDEAYYHGEFVNFDSVWSWPKPVQKPNPPVILGGHGSKALQRVVRYCDGWLPIAMRGTADVLKGMTELKQIAQEAGRDPKSISVSVFFAPPDQKGLDEFEKAGAARAIFGLPPAGRDQVLPLLDKYAKLISK